MTTRLCQSERLEGSTAAIEGVLLVEEVTEDHGGLSTLKLAPPGKALLKSMIPWLSPWPPPNPQLASPSFQAIISSA